MNVTVERHIYPVTSCPVCFPFRSHLNLYCRFTDLMRVRHNVARYLTITKCRKCLSASVLISLCLSTSFTIILLLVPSHPPYTDSSSGIYHCIRPHKLFEFPVPSACFPPSHIQTQSSIDFNTTRSPTNSI